MTTPQSDKLRTSTPERYEEMSRHLLRQAEDELDQGDALQASEKIWGATAHALKAVAQQRGWNHRFHNHLRSVALFLASEWNRPDWNNAFGSLESMHINFYEHQWHGADLRPRLGLARVFCEELTAVRQAVPPDSVQLTSEQQATLSIHLRILTRQLRDEAAFGEQFTEAELEDLPPVTPTST
jgi:hypothetical protein